MKNWWFLNPRLDFKVQLIVLILDSNLRQCLLYKYTNLKNAFFNLRFWWAKFVWPCSLLSFRAFYGAWRSLQFLSIFSKMKIDLNKKIHHVYWLTIGYLWAKNEGSWFCKHVPHFSVFTQSTKKFALNFSASRNSLAEIYVFTRRDFSHIRPWRRFFHHNELSRLPLHHASPLPLRKRCNTLINDSPSFLDPLRTLSSGGSAIF